MLQLTKDQGINPSPIQNPGDQTCYIYVYDPDGYRYSYVFFQRNNSNHARPLKINLPWSEMGSDTATAIGLFPGKGKVAIFNWRLL